MLKIRDGNNLERLERFARNSIGKQKTGSFLLNVRFAGWPSAAEEVPARRHRGVLPGGVRSLPAVAAPRRTCSPGIHPPTPWRLTTDVSLRLTAGCQPRLSRAARATSARTYAVSSPRYQGWRVQKWVQNPPKQPNRSAVSSVQQTACPQDGKTLAVQALRRR